MRGSTRMHPAAALSGVAVAALLAASAHGGVIAMTMHVDGASVADRDPVPSSFLTWVWSGDGGANGVGQASPAMVHDVDGCAPAAAAAGAGQRDIALATMGSGITILPIGQAQQRVDGMLLATLNIPITGSGSGAAFVLPTPAQGAAGSGGGSGARPSPGGPGNGGGTGNAEGSPPGGSGGDGGDGGSSQGHESHATWPRWLQMRLILLSHLPNLGVHPWDDFCHIDIEDLPNTDAVAIPLPAAVWMGLAGLVGVGLLRRRLR